MRIAPPCSQALADFGVLIANESKFGGDPIRFRANIVMLVVLMLTTYLPQFALVLQPR